MQRLVQENIRRVIIAVEDPFPQVSGRGITMLREAGIEVIVGCCSDEARWMCRRFLHVQEAGRPYIILKWAQSAGGYIAPADGSRYQLSNHFSQTLVHKWRTEESAILVGYNTALADNPRLTSRAWSGRQSLRLVLDRKLQLPASHHVFDGSAPTWIVNESDERGGRTCHIRLRFDESLLPSLLQRLKDANITSLIVEGGAKLLHSFVRSALWDEARVFHTPKIVGDGIAAPLLIGAHLDLTTSVGDDELCLYQQAGSSFPYPSGAIL